MDGQIGITGRCCISVRRKYLFSTTGLPEEGLSINYLLSPCPPFSFHLTGGGMAYLVGKSGKSN